MAEKKITKKDNYAELLGLDDVQARPNLVEFIEHELELLERKPAKQSKTQEANAGYADAIVEWMEPGTVYLVADITKGVPALVEDDVKSQRVTHIMTKLVEAGKVVNTKEKGKSYYGLAESEE